MLKRCPLSSFLFTALLFVAACAPEPGTEAWCKKMKVKPKADWTVNEAADFARYCVIGNYKDKK